MLFRSLLLIVNLAMWLLAPEDLSSLAVRISLLSAGLWWGLWTLIPYRRIQNTADHARKDVSFSTLAAGSFGQLAKTLRELSQYPQTRLFLLAYLFFNDGVQTVIASASVYGSEELKLGQTALVGAIVIVQIVAVFGALFTGKMAARFGAYRTVLNSLIVWTLVIVAGYFLPAGKATLFFLLAASIGFILGEIGRAHV